MFYKAQAILAASVRLSDLSNQIDDTSIMTIWGLLIMAEVGFDPTIIAHKLAPTKQELLRERQSHVSGLQRMVEMRGGLVAIKSLGVRCCLLW